MHLVASIWVLLIPLIRLGFQRRGGAIFSKSIITHFYFYCFKSDITVITTYNCDKINFV